MSLLDDPPIERDAKAGYSTICRRGDHKTCAMAKARCTCPCHGARQEPPRTKEVPL